MPNREEIANVEARCVQLWHRAEALRAERDRFQLIAVRNAQAADDLEAQIATARSNGILHLDGRA